MINSSIANIVNALLTLEKASGKPLQHNIGDIIKAEVVDLLPGGGVRLKIDGSLVTARTELVLQKDSVVFLRVSDDGLAGKGLKLQFAGYAKPTEGNASMNNFRETPLGQTINQLTKELSNNILANNILPNNILADNSPAANTLKNNTLADNILKDTKGSVVSLKTLDALLKALPDNINALPREVRLQLQGLLQASLKTTGQGIQARFDNFLTRQIPDLLKGHPLIAALKSDLMVSMDKLLNVSLKNVLQDTGVALESKLRDIAEILLKMDETQSSLQPNLEGKESQVVLRGKDNLVKLDEHQNNLNQNAVDKEPQQALHSKDTLVPDLKQNTNGQNNLNPNATDKGSQIPSGQASDSKETLARDLKQKAGVPDPLAVKRDLKAGLLRLKQILIDEGGELSRKLSGVSAGSGKTETAVKVIDQFLKDIETFQALSKTTDSFYTFLPVNWQELKNGDIVFKRMRKDDPVSPYSCRINLDLESCGELVIMVTMYKRDFFVSLKAANPDFQSVLASNSDKLQDTFREKGLNLMAVNVTDINDNSMEQADTFETSDKIISIKA